MTGLRGLIGPGASMIEDLPLRGFYEAFRAEIEAQKRNGEFRCDINADFIEIRDYYTQFAIPVLRGHWWSISAWGGFTFYELPTPRGRFDHGKAARTRLARRQKLRTVENLPRGSSAR